MTMQLELCGRHCFVLCCSATDTAFKDGKVGDYLFLGNMVYTVSGC